MTKAKIYYFSLTDEMLKNDKLLWFHNTKFQNISFENISPSKKNNWINLADNDFETLLPLADKDVKLGRSKKAVFELFSLGVVTARDEWVYDFNKNDLAKKVNYLIDAYNADLDNFKGKSKEEIKEIIGKRDNQNIKWTRAVINDISKGKKYYFDKTRIYKSYYRPFITKNLMFSSELNEMQYQQYKLFPQKEDINKLICVNHTSNKDFNILVSKYIPDYHLNGDAICLALYRYDSNGNRHDNLTDWGLSQFTEHYKDESITKEAIFYYTYSVLHHPAYRKKYALNLKREFPRLPFYKDFWQWSNKGKELMDLHLNYETVEPFALKRVDKAEPKKGADTLFADEKGSDALFGEEKGSDAFKASDPSKNPRKLKVKLKADKENGIIYIDEHTHLEGVPDIAWTYKLGNRSALEWILDQYKEKKPKDKTIAEKFDTYRFADYKETVIDLLMRVCTVSVRTVEIVNG